MFAMRQRRDLGSGPIYAGGFLSAFAISCPLCNGLLVAAFGTGAAANVFDPARPFIGGATALFHDLRALPTGSDPTCWL